MAAPTERAARMRGNLTSREQRLTESLITGLQELAEPERQPPKLSRSEPRGAIPAGRGYAESNYQPGSETSTGGGIASPLIEGEAPPPPPESNPEQNMLAEPNLDRLYWPQGLKSSDGLFVLPAIKELVMRDANGEKVVILLADPDAAVTP
jgi:hypothetical protein